MATKGSWTRHTSFSLSSLFLHLLLLLLLLLLRLLPPFYLKYLLHDIRIIGITTTSQMVVSHIELSSEVTVGKELD